MALGERLGCASEYTVTIHYQGGQRVYTYVDRVETLKWSRERRKISEATVTIAASGISETCAARLLQLHEWIHEVTVYRDGRAVWQGPIIDKTITVSGSQPIRITLVARDVAKWLEHRILRRTRKLTGTDLSEVGRAAVESALAVRDPNIVPHIITRPSGRSVDHTIQAYARKGFDELGDIAAQGVDWTCVGRSIFFDAPAGTKTEPQGRITGDDLIGEVDIESSGEDYASLVYAAPQAQDEVWQHLEGIGGASPYYGLVEYVVQTSLPYNLDDDGNFEPQGEDGLNQAQTEAALKRAAQARHTQMSRPPLVLRTPEGSRLAPSAPISIDRLVPGVRLDLAIAGRSPLRVQQAMRLTRVEVTWGPEGEEVGVSLVQIGGPEDREELEEP